MPVKDYYTTLGITPQSGIQDIKRAYRSMAMRYHPDKNQDDPRAPMLFREIQEAYAVLADPLMREKYHHERWMIKAVGKKFAGPAPATPYAVLLKSLELDRYMSRQDPFRTDKEGLLAYMLQLLDTDTLEMLLHHRDHSLNNRIAGLFLHAGRILDHTQVIPISERIVKLAPEKSKEIQRWLRISKQEKMWEKYKPLAAIVIALLLSIFIYFLAKN